MLAMLIGCGLRRSELAHLTVEQLQRREDHWTIVDLIGGRPYPNGARSELGQIIRGRLDGGCGNLSWPSLSLCEQAGIGLGNRHQ